MTRPRRIVHVVWGAGFGGIERFVSDLARAQAAETPRDPAVAQPAAAPMEVGVMVCGAEPADDSLARYESPDVVVHAGGLRSGFDVRPARLRVVAEELCKYDIVHLHGFMPGASLAVDRARRPVVFTEHGLLGLGRRWPSRAAVKQSAKGVFLRHRVHTRTRRSASTGSTNAACAKCPTASISRASLPRAHAMSFFGLKVSIPLRGSWL
jgi:glycosyltransferase involved in cell wall biosynthesis